MNCADTRVWDLLQYNEVVVDTKLWAVNLPYTIDAFFYMRGGGAEGYVRGIYEDFKHEYPDAPTIFVSLDTWDPEPFELA